MHSRTHTGKLLLGEEVVGVSGLTAAGAASPLGDAGLGGPLGGQAGDLGQGGGEGVDVER